MNPAPQEFLRAYSGRRVLVTGASGFLGRWAARALTRAKADVWLAARDLGALQAVCDGFGIHGELRAADFSEAGSFARLHEQVRPEVTFNLAGYGVDPGERDEALAWTLNVKLIEEIAEVTRRESQSGWTGLRLVHVGSAAEYGSVEGPVTEESEPKPLSPYGRTKLEGSKRLEEMVSRSGLRGTTARLFTVYGPGEHAGRLLPSLLAAARSHEELRLTRGEQQRDFTYVGEVVEGLLRLGCTEERVPAVVNMATGRLTRVRDFAECAAKILGLPEKQLQFGALPSRRDDLEQGPCSTALLERILGWKPALSIADGIRQTAAFQGQCAGARTK
jgi:nucleoside-diphosphate-sugar epimerase